MQGALQGACRAAAEHTVEWVAARLNSPGGLGEDLAAHYKAPYLLQLAGRPLLRISHE